MVADAAATCAASQGQQDVDSLPRTFTGCGAAAACSGVVLEEDSTTSTGFFPGELAPAPRPHPATTAIAPAYDCPLLFSRHQISGDEERGDCAETIAINHYHPGASEELESNALASSVSCSRRRCGGRVVVVLELARSTAKATMVSFLALLAILVFFWALTPVCTSCVRSSNEGPATAVAPEDEQGRSTLYINQLQVIGTHNSYHQRTYIRAMNDFWDYHYPSLTDQLDAGVRHLELDIHYDWKTGRWFVFHVSILDPMSSCHCLAVCLAEIREWSDAHPMHHILFIEIELKLFGDFLQLCGQKTPDADHAAFRAMQGAVIDEFPLNRILTPREVRGDYETLTEAIYETTAASKLFGPSPEGNGAGSSSSGSSGGAEHSESDGSMRGRLKGGWPLVDETRGKVLFIIDYQSTNRLCRPAVRKALPEDETVFFERTPLDEIGHSDLLAFGETSVGEEVEELVRSGVIVRNRVIGGDWDSRSASEYEDGQEPLFTYIVDSPAQLMVWDDLSPVQKSKAMQGEEKDGLRTTLPCRSRCSAIVPEDECVLEGFC